MVVLTTSNKDRDRVDVTFHTFADVMATLNKYWTLMEMPQVETLRRAAITTSNRAGLIAEPRSDTKRVPY